MNGLIDWRSLPVADTGVILTIADGTRVWLDRAWCEAWSGPVEELALIYGDDTWQMDTERGIDRDPTPVELAALTVKRRLRADLKRRAAQQAKAALPRPSARHPGRARALEIAAAVRAKSPRLTASTVANIVIDQLAREGFSTPSARSICGWISEIDAPLQKVGS